jgi:hypothetical protein
MYPAINKPLLKNVLNIKNIKAQIKVQGKKFCKVTQVKDKKKSKE